MHTQALEHLVKLAEANEEVTKKLVENLGQKMESPKLPEKIEVHNNVRRSGTADATEHPIVTFARKMPSYGIFFKDVLLAELKSDEEPVAVVENNSSS